MYITFLSNVNVYFSQKKKQKSFACNKFHIFSYFSFRFVSLALPWLFVWGLMSHLFVENKLTRNVAGETASPFPELGGTGMYMRVCLCVYLVLVKG